jgi:uroporphyrinogen III methyltransferase/synthase
VFTSANGIEWFVKRLTDTGRDVRAMAGAKLAAIGPKTAASLEALRLKVDYVPSEFVAEAVVREFPGDVSGKSILIPRAAEARDELPEGLRAKGASVEVVAVYQTVTDTACAEDLRRTLSEEAVDVITFTSASTVNSFFVLAGDAKVPEDVTIACIGPITAEAARAHGLEPAVVAEEHTIDGLVSELAARLVQPK